MKLRNFVFGSALDERMFQKDRNVCLERLLIYKLSVGEPFLERCPMHQQWSSRRFLIIYGLLILSWSSAFPAVKVGLSAAPPVFFAAIRTVLGGLCLMLPAWLLGGRINPRQMLPHWLWTMLFFSFLFFGLQTFAVSMLPSGMTAVLVYLQPILVGWMAHHWLGERLTWNKTLGLFLGFLGVLVVGWEGVMGSLSLLGMLFGVGAAFGWGVGTVYVKRVQQRVPLLWLLAGQFTIGGCILFILSGLFEDWTAVTWNGTFWATVLYTSIVCISMAWVLYFALIERGETSRIAANMFLVPLVSVLMGVVFLKETVSLYLFLGGGLIVAGIFLVNRSFSGGAKGKRLHPNDLTASHD